MGYPVRIYQFAHWTVIDLRLGVIKMLTGSEVRLAIVEMVVEEVIKKINKEIDTNRLR